ncbi:MAG: hypothetical protein WCH99_00730 [Verrucomicrobiota bacterium]
MLVSLGVQGVIGYADFATGSELHLDVFYFIPMAITAWYLRRSDVVISALVGALTWGYAEIRSGHHYSHLGYWYWNILVSFTSLLILGLAVKALRDNLKHKEEARQELLKALIELRQSTAEVQKLQGELQVICAWTKRIRVEDKWMTIEEFLRDHLHIKLSHGISPEAKDKLTKEAETIKRAE